MILNIRWHKENKMPKKPSPEERLKWHMEHAKHCPCRPIPEKLKRQIEQPSL